MMKLDEVKQKYKDEWVLAEIIQEDELGRPAEIKVIAHSKSRVNTYHAMRLAREKYLTHFYTGEIPKKGYAVAFYGRNTL